MQLLLSVVLPCYNEEEIISKTNNRLTSVLDNLVEKKIIDEYEIIYIDDGSFDNTLDILKQLSEADKKIKVISFSKNFGHQIALLAGIVFASGDAIVSMDADLQDPPEVIEDMLTKYKEGYEIVYGARKERSADSFFKRFTAQTFYKLMQLLGVRLVYNSADFRLVSKRVAQELKKFQEINIFLRGIIPSLGFSQTTVKYIRPTRLLGKTKYSTLKLLGLAWEGITSFSFAPLRCFTILGLFLSFLSLLGIIWVLICKLTYQIIPGWTSLALILLIFSSMQFMFLGILGEYIAKIYKEIKHRPLFIIKEKINFPSEYN